MGLTEGWKADEAGEDPSAGAAKGAVAVRDDRRDEFTGRAGPAGVAQDLQYSRFHIDFDSKRLWQTVY